MGKSSGTQKTTSETKLPEWYTSAAKSNIKFANEAADNIAQPYMGETVAGLDPLQQQAINATGQNIGATNGAFNSAIGTAGQVASYIPQNFLQGDIGAYMSPFIQNVEQAAQAGFDQQFAGNMNRIGDTALASKAFGGSRQGIQEGVAAAESARQRGEFSSNLRQAGYQQAAGQMTSDMDRALQGQQLNLQGAQQVGALAGQGQDAYLQGLNSALAAGQINQQQAQQLLDQEANRYNAMRNVPLDQLNIRMAPLQGVQVPTSTTQKTPTTGNGFLSALGGIGSIIGGLGTAGIISDRKAKTNIKKLGKDGLTGLDLYSYDYKDDVAEAKRTGKPMGPKRVGPMAQDIGKMRPGSTRRVGGKLIVANLGFGG